MTPQNSRNNDRPREERCVVVGFSTSRATNSRGRRFEADKGQGRGASPRRLVALFGAAGLLGAANGCSSGLVMTLSTDIAPRDLRGAFLSLFRLVSDAGILVGSAVVGVVSDAFALHVACSATAVAALVAIAFLACCVEETRPPAAAADDDKAADAPRTLLESARRAAVPSRERRPAYARLAPEEEGDDGAGSPT